MLTEKSEREMKNNASYGIWTRVYRVRAFHEKFKRIFYHAGPVYTNEAFFFHTSKRQQNVYACRFFNLIKLVIYPAILFLNRFVLMVVIWFRICLFSSKLAEYSLGSLLINSLATRLMKSGRTFPIVSRILYVSMVIVMKF